jgi:hypothetical protein
LNHANFLGVIVKHRRDDGDPNQLPCLVEVESQGSSRSASDATSLLYTTGELLRGPSVPPVGFVGSAAAVYDLLLNSILVKVLLSVTENRYVTLM